MKRQAAAAPVLVPKPPELATIGTGHALVEASAGTGKTHLIEHLVVDLLLERGLTLDQILVVTFSERAAADLVVRIRRRLHRLAHVPEAEAAQGGTAGDGAPCWNIDDSARARLRAALLAFDRASISTIHAFCQRVLASNAFLCGQVIEQRLVDEDEALHTAFVEALRRDIAPHPDRRPLLEAWLGSGRTATRLEELLAESLREMRRMHSVRPGALRPVPPDGAALASALDFLHSTDLARLERDLKTAGVDRRTIPAVLGRLTALRDIAGRFSGAASRAALHRDVDALEQEKPGFFAYLWQRLPPCAGTPPVAELLRHLPALTTPLEAVVVHAFLPVVRERLAAHKRAAGLHDYQDMLSLLAQAIDGASGEMLIATLRAQYRAALIDEFQDTDEVQWHFFRRVFLDAADRRTLIAVGDPKQAIYGFRGADVPTYLRAQDEVRDRGGQTANLTRTFRSSAPLTDALNLLLDASGESPLFRAEGAIRYDHPVTCARAERLLVDADGARPPAVVVLDVVTREATLKTAPIKQALLPRMAEEIRDLLTTRPLFSRADGAPARRIGPGDIFVLTRTNREAREAGEALKAEGVRFALFRHEKLFETVEARELLDLLRALVDPDDRTARARAFISGFFGLALPDLAACDRLPAGHPLLARLVAWKALGDAGDWTRLFSALTGDSGILRRDAFLHDDERSLTNTLHLVEILHEEAVASRSTLRELAHTLSAWVRGARTPAGQDSDVQRLETERAAVKIATVHQAKGLEAEIVFLYGGLWPVPARLPSVLHDDGGRRVVSLDRKDSDDWTRAGAEDDDEERRVLYVGLTRARLRLYLPRYPHAFKTLRGSYRHVNARLHALFGGFDRPATGDLFSLAAVPCPAPRERQPDAAPAVVAAWRPPEDALAGPPADDLRALGRARAGREVTSYSALKRRRQATLADDADRDGDPGAGEAQAGVLAGALAAAARPGEESPELPRGRGVGNFLHEVLEHLPLEPLGGGMALPAWRALADTRAVFERAARRHDQSPAHVVHAERLAHGALATPTRLGSVTIPALASARRAVREMEFLYRVPARGMVRGFIDFMFEHEGRSYVCDWKTDLLPSWDAERVAEHCRRHYDLQARIYTLAALRVLGISDQSAFEAAFGGVVTCFLRGRRADDAEAGVHFQHPRWDDVLAWEEAMREPDLWSRT